MMRSLTLFMCLALWALPAAAQPQPQEALEADISAREVAIKASFTGARIVVFGTIENSQQTGPESGLYDIAVVIRGPEERMVARRKARVAGIWVNRDSIPFDKVPGFYAVLTTRPLEEVARPEILRTLGIGYRSLPFIPKDAAARDDGSDPARPFQDAVIRLMQQDNLYLKDEYGVVFIGRSLFRATLDLPANVPVGDFAADVFLFRDGKLLSQNRSKLNIHKEGFERIVYRAAFDYPLVYGIIAVILAVAAGLLASAVFRNS